MKKMKKSQHAKRDAPVKPGRQVRRTGHGDLDAFFGSWTADAEVDRALGEQRRIDRELWR